MKTAIVIGATGMVGQQLVQHLLRDSRFDKVKTFTRKSIFVQHDKLEEHLVNFDDMPGWRKLLTGDVLYSAMGTTLKAAGSKEEQYKVDHTYQYQVAKAAATNGVTEYVLISAAGASPDSKIFYSRMKGELERDIKKLPFEKIHIIRPGMLAGEREHVRTGEKLGIGVMSMIGAIPGLQNLRPIEAKTVACAMINATFRPLVGIHSYTMGDVFKLAKRNEVVKQPQ